MIIAVDYDGTLYKDKQINLNLIARLQAEQRKGNIVILWTCRSNKHIAEALRTLQDNGFMPNYVNQNVPQIIRQFGYDPRKIYADIYIDDKAVTIK